MHGVHGEKAVWMRMPAVVVVVVAAADVVGGALLLVRSHPPFSCKWESEEPSSPFNDLSMRVQWCRS